MIENYIIIKWCFLRKWACILKIYIRYYDRDWVYPPIFARNSCSEHLTDTINLPVEKYNKFEIKFALLCLGFDFVKNK